MEREYAECALNKNDEGNELEKVMDNVEMIRLRRCNKRQAAHIAALTDHLEAAEKELLKLRKMVEKISHESGKTCVIKMYSSKFSDIFYTSDTFFSLKINCHLNVYKKICMFFVFLFGLILGHRNLSFPGDSGKDSAVFVEYTFNYTQNILPVFTK